MLREFDYLSIHKMKKYVALLIGIILIALSSCEKGIDDNKTNLNSDSFLAAEDITVINGIFVFRTEKILDETLDKIAKMSVNEYNEWIDNFGFVSLQSIYHAIIIAEDNYDNRLEKNLESLHDYNGIRHSSLYMKYLRDGLIREIYDKQVNSEYYELNTSLPWLSSILNKDGIFMVGKFVYQSSPDFLKIWENGDVNSLERFKQINQETGDIKFVIKNQSQSKKSTFDPNPATSDWAYKGDDRRIRINVYFETWQYLSDGTVWKYVHYINVKSRKLNFWNNWKYNWTDMSIKGSWDGDFDYIDPYDPQIVRHYNFSASYPSNYPSYYQVYASDLYASISIFDGSDSPYPTTWSLSYYTGGQYVEILDISVYNLQWEAIGHGDAVATIP